MHPTNRVYQKAPESYSEVKGKNPLLDMGLDPAHVLDLLRVCFSKTLDCKLLTKIENGQYKSVNLIGENHERQDRQSYNLGLDLIKHYEVIGHEGRQLGTLESLVAWTSEPWSSGALTLLKISCFSTFKGSPVISLEKGAKEDDFFTPIGKKIYYIQKCLVFGILVGCIASYVNYFPKRFSLINPSILLGLYLLIKLQSSFVDYDKFYRDLRTRDEEMGNGLLGLFDSGASSVAAVMGASHIYGVSRHLKNKGFIDLKSELMEQYNTFNSNPQYREALKGTECRDLNVEVLYLIVKKRQNGFELSSPDSHRSCWPVVSQISLRTYPEDFENFSVRKIERKKFVNFNRE